MNHSPIVDTNLCRACGTCVAECVRHWVAPRGHPRAPNGHPGAERPQHVDPARADCERCLHCYAVCPAGAIRLPKAYSALAAPDAWREVRPEALESLLAQRPRSVL